jgi:hypothetical protein
MLYYLIYFSKACQLMQEEDLTKLLHQSRQWNEAHSLTGMLVYLEGRFVANAEGRFMQVLEGPKDEVQYIFEKIKHDNRHHRVMELSNGLLDKRNFKGWQMGFESINLETDNTANGYLKLEDSVFESKNLKDCNLALNFLRSFYTANRTLP